MAGRVQQLAAVVRDDYAGDASQIWASAATTAELVKQLKALPGFGDQKARIFAALPAKQLDVRLDDGWRDTIGPYAADGSFRSVADVVDEGSLQQVRDVKKAAKAAADAATD